MPTRFVVKNACCVNGVNRGPGDVVDAADIPDEEWGALRLADVMHPGMPTRKPAGPAESRVERQESRASEEQAEDVGEEKTPKPKRRRKKKTKASDE